MDTEFSSGQSSPLDDWDDCEDNATCDEISLLDDEDELQALQVSQLKWFLFVLFLFIPNTHN